MKKRVKRVALLHSKKDYLYLLLSFILILSLSLSYQYYNYKQLTQSKTAYIQAKVLKQYHKKNHQILKLKSSRGFEFYTRVSNRAPNYKGKHITMKIWIHKLSFLSYMRGFFAFSKISHIKEESSYKRPIEKAIEKQHNNHQISAIYEALFLAKPLPYKLQQKFADLGISHLIAISGFHLGVLSALLFFLIKIPYKFLQNRYFPYRSQEYDTFIIISLLLLVYMLFLGTPPSLLRSYTMLLIGFFLYESGIKIISMQTLLLTVLLLVALFPRLIFSVGFFLSISGVFYIFLFMIHFQYKGKIWQFTILPFWVYLMMLPYSLVLFGNFSLYHPLSILWTSLFSLFYPLSIFLHLVGEGALLDTMLKKMLTLDPHAIKFHLSYALLYIQIGVSILVLIRSKLLKILLLYDLSILIYSVYHVAQL
jgi:competence protein ComEC